MNNAENTPFVDANLRKAYRDGLNSPDWQTCPYESDVMIAAYNSGRAERQRRRMQEETDAA